MTKKVFYFLLFAIIGSIAITGYSQAKYDNSKMFSETQIYIFKAGANSTHNRIEIPEDIRKAAKNSMLKNAMLLNSNIPITDNVEQASIIVIVDLTN